MWGTFAIADNDQVKSNMQFFCDYNITAFVSAQWAIIFICSCR